MADACCLCGVVRICCNMDEKSINIQGVVDDWTNVRGCNRTQVRGYNRSYVRRYKVQSCYMDLHRLYNKLLFPPPFFSPLLGSLHLHYIMVF